MLSKGLREHTSPVPSPTLTRPHLQPRQWPRSAASSRGWPWMGDAENKGPDLKASGELLKVTQIQSLQAWGKPLLP